MKRIIAFTAAFAMLWSISQFSAAAASSAVIYVTIADASGNLAVAYEPFTVTDTDGDGILTINDALFTAHEEKYSGGAASGYGTSVTDYGTGLTKLWGGGSGSGFGYYVNNASALSLMDTVKSGDCVNAFAYTDTATFSDTYCYFDKNTVGAEQNASVTLALYAAGFDESWNPIVLPVADAEIMLDGKATAFRTSSDGTVTVSVADAGKHVISARSDAQTLVPPVCVASVSAAKGKAAPSSPAATGVTSAVPFCAVIGMASLLGMAASRRRSK